MHYIIKAENSFYAGVVSEGDKTLTFVDSIAYAAIVTSPEWLAEIIKQIVAHPRQPVITLIPLSSIHIFPKD